LQRIKRAGMAQVGLADHELKTKIERLGGDPMPMTPEQFGEFFAQETAQQGKHG
jgi:hypothetical protein